MVERSDTTGHVYTSTGSMTPKASNSDTTGYVHRIDDAEGVKAISRWLSEATPPDTSRYVHRLDDAEGVKAISRW